MITKEKLDIFISYQGDVDAFAHAKKSEKKIMADEDFFLINCLLQDFRIITKGNASIEFAKDAAKKLILHSDNQSTIDYFNMIVVELDNKSVEDLKRNKIDYLFFLIFNYYYKDGNYKTSRFTKFYPWYYTLFVISFGTMLWTILIFSMGLYYLVDKIVTSSYAPMFLACYFIYFTLFYNYFIKQNRYEEIYGVYKD
ncbi:MAG TPA: hypothetical protein VHQ04_00385, partial [Puia sp.]|nr:hypothetical protein [Puia sp.]